MTDKPARPRIEFWVLLRSQGFPANIDDEAVQRATERIEAVSGNSGFPGRLRRWSRVEAGLHSDDVALTQLVADGLGLREGVDWDWAVEPDGYHYSVAHVDTPQTEELARLLELYHDAITVFMHPKQGEGKTSEQLHQLFREERKRVREEKQWLHDETAEREREAFNQIDF